MLPDVLATDAVMLNLNQELLMSSHVGIDEVLLG